MADQLPLWDGRYASTRLEVNAEPLPRVRSALYEAKSLIDRATAAMDVVTARGPGWVGAAPLLNDAIQILDAARARVRAEANEQARRGLAGQQTGGT